MSTYTATLPAVIHSNFKAQDRGKELQIPEVMRRLGITQRQSIYYMIAYGRLKAHKAKRPNRFGGNNGGGKPPWVVFEKDLADFIEGRQSGSRN